MLLSYIVINRIVIDIIYMHNQEIVKRGKHLYSVWKDSDKENIKQVWHKRDDGWQKLLSLVLKKLS